MRGSVDAFAKLERDLGYEFCNKKLLHQALTHRSNNALNNERLEFLGDSILNFVIGLALFYKFTHAKEGQLSRMRSTLVRESTLATLAKRFDLGNKLLLGPGELKSGGMHRDSILSDTFEAVVAAIYMDNGNDMNALISLVWKWFEDFLIAITPEEPKDPKTKLQEYLQGRAKALPHYQVVGVRGVSHSQVFSVCCNIGDLNMNTIGEGSNRRRAEQDAADKALKSILEKQGHARK